jgi:hypothetical protein
MIDTVINYCSNDFRFIVKNVTESLKFSDRVIIPMISHFLNGVSDEIGITKTIEALQNLDGSDRIVFIQYEWDSSKSSRYHHNMSRWIGLQDSQTDYVMFLDADEIVEGDLMKQYLSTQKHFEYDVIAFKSYWYFREPIYRATTTELAASLWNRKICVQDIIFSESERWSYRHHRNIKSLEDETYNGNVMCHHYSWVRNHQQMLNKVQSWGHNKDKNWTTLVNEEFSRPFNGTDFVHGYSYDIVPNLLD